MASKHQNPSYPLRLPPEIRNRLLESSQAQFRSLHNEILTRLIDSLNRDKSQGVVNAHC
jgi:hypothetical protein